MSSHFCNNVGKRERREKGRETLVQRWAMASMASSRVSTFRLEKRQFVRHTHTHAHTHTHTYTNTHTPVWVFTKLLTQILNIFRNFRPLNLEIIMTIRSFWSRYQKVNVFNYCTICFFEVRFLAALASWLCWVHSFWLFLADKFVLEFWAAIF